jgi:hypothetical protein
MNSKEIYQIQKNVKATLRIEGCHVSQSTEKINKNYLEGSISSQEAVYQIKQQYLSGYQIYKGKEVAIIGIFRNYDVATKVCKHMNKKYNKHRDFNNPAYVRVYTVKPVYNRFAYKQQKADF